MTLSLYDVTIPAFQQSLTALTGVLQKGEAHALEKGMRPDEWAGARLFADMAPLNFQVMQTVHHSVGAIEATKKGVFSPDVSPAPDTLNELKSAVGNALTKLATYRANDINELEGRDMRFEFRDRIMPFTAENFLLSFSLPNFYFHATTAYDILRHNGVPLGKRDDMGMPRLKQ